jgi:phytoene dehydrogenase-like protein
MMLKSLHKSSLTHTPLRPFATKTAYDAVIIGSGHNGLVCANYLAKANMKVLVLERRHIVGGAAVSEEIFPGYVHSRASYLLSLLRKNIIDELFPADWRKDLVLYEREYPSFTPTKQDGKYLLLGHKHELKEIAKFS